MALTNNQGGVGYRIYGDNSDYKASIDDARSYAEKQAEGIGNAFKTAFVAAGAAVTAAITLGVRYNANIEQYTKTFQGLLQSEEKAGQLMKDLSEYAQQTSFDIDGLANSAKTMLAYGIDEAGIVDTIKMLGDISMGSTENMNRLALALGQMQAKGKVVTEDLRQMQEVGFNPLEYIMRITGESMSELTDRLEDGGVSVDEVTKAMQLATSEGEKFYKMTSLQADTLTGKWNELKEKASEAFGKMTAEINEALSKKVIPAVIKFVESIDFDQVKKAITGVIDTIKKLSPVILAALAVWLKFKAAMVIQGVLSKVTKGINSLANAISSGGGLIGGVKNAISAFGNLRAALVANPWMLLATAVAGVTAALVGAAAATSGYNEEQKKMIEEAEEARRAAEEQAEATRELRDARNEAVTQGLSEIEHVQSLYEELQTLADAEGRVKEESKGRAEFILGQLNSALGTEYKMTGNIISNYRAMQGEIDNLIEKKKAKIIFDAMEEEYAEAVKNQAQVRQKALEDEAKLTENLAKQEAMRKDIYEGLLKTRGQEAADEFNRLWESEEGYRVAISITNRDLRSLLKAESELRAARDESAANLSNNLVAIQEFGDAYLAYESGNTDALQEMWDRRQTGMASSLSASSDDIDAYVMAAAEQWDNAREYAEYYGKQLEAKVPGYTKEGLEQALEEAEKKEQAFRDAGGNLAIGVGEGVSAKTSYAVSKVSGMVNSMLKKFNLLNRISSPAKAWIDRAKWIPIGVAQAVEESPEPEMAVRDMTKKMQKEFDVEGRLSHSVSIATQAASIPAFPDLTNRIELHADAYMDGMKVGQIVLKNLDDVAAFALRGNIR